MGARTGDPEAWAADVQRAVEHATGLVCSVGIGDNRLRAKLTTGFAKPAGDQPRVICWSALPQADRLLACHTAGSTAAARAVSTALSTDRRRPPPTPPAFPRTVTSPGTRP